MDRLSKGNQQKVQLLLAVGHDPDLIVLDEPVSGLDPVHVAVVRDILRALREQGRTVVLSSHQLEQIEDLVDDVAIIHNGTFGRRGPLDARRSRRGVRIRFRSAAPLDRSGLAEGRVLAAEPGETVLELDGAASIPVFARAAAESGQLSGWPGPPPPRSTASASSSTARRPACGAASCTCAPHPDLRVSLPATAARDVRLTPTANRPSPRPLCRRASLHLFRLPAPSWHDGDRHSLDTTETKVYKYIVMRR